LSAIRSLVPEADVAFDSLDLADLSTVQPFGDRFAARSPSLHLLINNAGVMNMGARRLTKDGFEIQFGTNHLGHFALTAVLLPLLKSADKPRVVTMSSLAHRIATLDLTSIREDGYHRPMADYGRSKLANILFARELQRRSIVNDWGILSVAAHPGASRTQLLVNATKSGQNSSRILRLLESIMMQSAADGARPALFAATANPVETGGYYGPNGLLEIKGWPAKARSNKLADDTRLAGRLWALSEELTGRSFI
jgi:NAD(P)-dependent dehydrogenase (short-subunit alcohol dehydrogenase family)